jgi:hypothetical protein
MSRRALVLLVAAAAAVAPACRKLEPPSLDPVRALRARVRPGFRAPSDGLLTAAQVDTFLRVRRAAGSRPESVAASALGADPAEIAWVRARIGEAILLIDARRVAEASAEEYASSLARLRETRRTTKDPKAAAKIDVEIGALERERAAARRDDAASPAVVKNAALVAPRRSELERLGP